MENNISKFKSENNFFKRIRSFAGKAEMDRAVLYGISSKMWGFIAGPVSAFLITTTFTSELQGYYYTFATILALQVFVELGLGAVTQQFASHEWAKLSLSDNGKISGDDDSISRLTSIARISFKWFFGGSFVVAIGLLIGGYFFFSTSENYNINWTGPWASLCILSGINILLVPFWSLLEGCNQVKNLYGFRFLQAIILNFTIWISIVFDAGLWAASFGSIISIFCAMIFIKKKYWSFFKQLFLTIPSGAQIQWKKDMLPMQWRIALSWISGYFCFSLFTPILFKFQGPTVAGQFGMTWNIINAIGAIASSWLSPRIPQFAILIAKNNYKELDKLFWKIVRIIFILVSGVSFLFWCFIFFLPFAENELAKKLASRLLPPLPAGLLMIAQILIITSTPFSAYMRAHKKEPLMYLSVIAAVLIGISTVVLGKMYSVTGLSLGYLAINALLIPLVIIVWYRFRAKHASHSY